MRRRQFIQLTCGACCSGVAMGMTSDDLMDTAAKHLREAIHSGQLSAASMIVQTPESQRAWGFGEAKTPDDVFLIASISKPISVAALLTLFDRGEFQLDDPVLKFIPEFRRDGRDSITIRHLLTHVSGLPDQLPENAQLRSRHAPLATFVEAAIKTPLRFAPGTRYGYSSMAILLASEIAGRITGQTFEDFVSEVVLKPLGMTKSAMGLGSFQVSETMQCQVDSAAPESGAGDPDAKSWDWNSQYWRALGAPWGGAHSTAPDIGRFLAEFLNPTEKILNTSTARLMITNQNPPALRSRGLGFVVGTVAGSPGCSEATFGHDGATGTTAWADPQSGTICVVLTTLPGGAAKPHPRDLASDAVARLIANGGK